MNLVTGHVTEHGVIQSYAIDSGGVIRWKYRSKKKTEGEETAIVNCDKAFVIKCDNVLTALAKINGNVLWCDTLKNSINNVYKWGDKILTYCLVNLNGRYPDKGNFEYNVALKLINVKDGMGLWETSFSSFNTPSLSICNGKLLISDIISFRTFSIETGKMLSKELISEGDKGKYSFEMITDFMSGDYYLKSYKDVIYW